MSSFIRKKNNILVFFSSSWICFSNGTDQNREGADIGRKQGGKKTGAKLFSSCRCQLKRRALSCETPDLASAEFGLSLKIG